MMPGQVSNFWVFKPRNTTCCIQLILQHHFLRLNVFTFVVEQAMSGILILSNLMGRTYHGLRVLTTLAILSTRRPALRKTVRELGTVTSMGHKVKKSKFIKISKSLILSLKCIFMKHMTSLLTILRSFGFRCPLKEASGGVKGFQGAFLH